MSVIKETSRLDGFGNQPNNYLIDWARRTGNVATIANYTVDVTQDEDTGFLYGSIRAITDQPAAPVVVDSEPLVEEVPVDQVIQNDA